MPSNEHEWILELLRNGADMAPYLLRKLDVTLPEYDEVRTESADVNSLTPVEFRADLVLFLTRRSRYVLGIIVEVQRTRDERKCYSWPSYVANLRARHRCPVCLFVITDEESVARWAGRTIHLGPGIECTPWVLGPSNTPIVTDLKQAQNNVELAMLSAYEHRNHPNPELARRIAETALQALSSVNEERAAEYFDSIHLFLKGTPVPEDNMGSLESKYRSDYVLRYVRQGIAEGKAEGKIEGRVELILELLATRFGPLPDPIQTLVRGASATQLYDIGKQVLSAQTLEEALHVLHEK